MLRLIKFLSVFALVLLIAGTVSAYWLVKDYMKSPLPGSEDPVKIELATGSSLTGFSHQLSDQGLLKWPEVFIAYARLTDQTNIRAGEYQLVPGETPATLLTKLISGDVINYQLTFPEGLNFKEWLTLLQAETRLNHTLDGLSSTEIIQQLSLDVDHLEGWFFPDTYSYSASDSDRDILLRAHSQMKRVLDEEWQAREADLPFQSSYEALILASIVEKETGVDSERGEIAGVFVRRIQQGMRLQTDPTVIYGLGEQYQGNLTRRHLRQKTPYNTYLINGLPPTPIAMPGREAIHATLHPEKGDALYFVAKGDGSHYFSATLDEHINAVRKYQLQRRSNYRSSPEK